MENIRGSAAGRRHDKKQVMNFLLRTYIRVCNLNGHLALGCHLTEEKNVARSFKKHVESMPPDTHVLFSGSRFEGLSLPDVSFYSNEMYPQRRRHKQSIFSDIDMMFVDVTQPVSTSLSSEAVSPSGHPWYARVESHLTHPGYCRLVSSAGESSKTYININSFKNALIKKTNYIEIFAAIRGESGLSLNKMETEFHQTIATDHGPAVTMTVPREMSAEMETEMDVLGALIVPEWPTQASEWPSRHRRYDWPSKTLLEDITSKGCHIVPVPHSTSNRPEVEWRMSFSQAEKLLAHSINHVQRQCYLLMKILYYYELKLLGGISSYHLKTCLFWACESTPLPFWRTDNIWECFQFLLDTVIHCLASGNLPNYFIKSNNMIDKLSRESKLRILNHLIHIKNNLLSVMLPFQGIYNENLHKKKHLIQIIWDRLFLNHYERDTYYRPSPPPLTQVFQPLLKAIECQSSVTTGQLTLAYLMIAAVMPLVKRGNHYSYMVNDENATWDLFAEFAHYLHITCAYEATPISLVCGLAKIIVSFF